MSEKHSIQIQSLHVSYDSNIVLNDVNLSIAKGKVTGIVGPNGAGKTTLLKAILGLLEPNTGSVSVLGKTVQEVRKKIAYVPQKDGVDWQFPTTVWEVVMMGRYPHKSLFQGLNETDKQIATNALESVGMTDFKNRQIGELSGGQQQRVFIARALCQEADILMLDEPFVGVDIKTENMIVELLQSLATTGKTVLIIHHDLSKAEAYFHNIIILNKGIIAEGEVATTFTKENLTKAYGGGVMIF